MSADRYIYIDEEGYFAFDGKRVDDQELGRTLLDNLKYDDQQRLLTSMKDVPAFVEYFDAPLIARHVHFNGAQGEIDLPYGMKSRFDFSGLSVDQWDRFHGTTDKNIPFIFSRQAQVEFFDMLDSFDDDSITVKGKEYSVPPWLMPNRENDHQEFWSDLYKTGDTGWEMGHEAPALSAILPQLKMVKSRVLVLGCGSGHDAAFFAKAGHVVTAVDFSGEAIARAKKNYGQYDNLSFFQADAFNLPEKWFGEFDLIFEHTCYCAISPDKRDELVKNWRKLLQPQGHLLGIFFAHEKRVGPPTGGSEWEVRQRLKPGFDFLYWMRWHQSQDKRKGKELIVYARKKD